MKAFVFSLIALLILCGIVVLNTSFVSTVSGDMQEAISKIKSSPTRKAIEELENIWDNNKMLVSISVPHKETDELERNLILLRAKFDNDDLRGLNEVISLISRSIEELEVHGTVGFDNVF